MSPAMGPIATAAAVALAVLLGVSASSWRHERMAYELRIAELNRASDRAQSTLRTELAACRSAGESQRVTDATFAARAATPEGARRLLEQQPEGIDACARMESADRAVLSNLKK